MKEFNSKALTWHILSTNSPRDGDGLHRITRAKPLINKLDHLIVKSLSKSTC